MKKIKRNEKGAANVVSLMLGIIILLSLMVSALDASMYFMTRSQIQAAARDGARSVAIFGGAGEAGANGKITELQKAYGNIEACNDVPHTATNGRIVECEVYSQLTERGGMLSNGSISKVTCGPVVTEAMGTPTYCDIQWKYESLPGSPITIFTSQEVDSSKSDSPLQLASQKSGRKDTVFQGTKIITGTSQSEVKLETSDLVPRR